MFLLGRLIFGGYFVYNGINHLRAPRQIAEMAASQGVPLPMVAAVGTDLLLLVGGTLVLLGLLPRVGAALIAIFFVGVTPVMHAFWTFDDPMQRQMQLIQFTKNLALLGASPAFASLPTPWPMSLGALRQRRWAREAPV